VAGGEDEGERGGRKGRREREREETKRRWVRSYLQGLEAIQKGHGFVSVVFCSAGVGVGVRRGPRLRQRRGAALFPHLLGEFILLKKQSRGQRRTREHLVEEINKKQQMGRERSGGTPTKNKTTGKEP